MPFILSWANKQWLIIFIYGKPLSKFFGCTLKLSHFTEINYAMPLNFVHMNKDAFDGLSQEAQKAILDAAAKADARNWEALASRVASNYSSLRDNGVTILEEITPELQEHLSSAASAVLADWKEKAGATGEEVLQAYSKSVGRSF